MHTTYVHWGFIVFRRGVMVKSRKDLVVPQCQSTVVETWWSWSRQNHKISETRVRIFYWPTRVAGIEGSWNFQILPDRQTQLENPDIDSGYSGNMGLRCGQNMWLECKNRWTRPNHVCEREAFTSQECQESQMQAKLSTFDSAWKDYVDVPASLFLIDGFCMAELQSTGLNVVPGWRLDIYGSQGAWFCLTE